MKPARDALMVRRLCNDEQMPGEPPIAQMLQDWKQAEERARNAEVLVYRAYRDFMSGKGAGPSDQLRADASKLRQQARAAYQAAMSAVDRVLDEADKRSRGF